VSELDLAMEKHMANIVTRENRPFSHGDFLAFETDGKEYKMTPWNISQQDFEVKERWED
jgi:hypothetical protein